MRFPKIIFGLIAALSFVFPLVAQVRSLPLAASAALPPAALSLSGTPAQVKGQVKPTEAILDLVRAYNHDSVLHTRKQRHNGLLGWTMHRGFARFWEYRDTVKRTYIGSSSRDLVIWDGIKKEMDINVFLMPSLPAYVAMARAAFDAALERGRPEEHYRLDRPPFTPDEALRHHDRGYITIECEVTPPEASRAAFSERFFPMTPGSHRFEDDPRFGVQSPSIGLYGAWCLDCNHNCRPEVHPIEWMWWLDMSPDDPAHPDDWQWMIGLVRDGTERFEDWSAAPLQGRIAIPIAIPAGASAYAVRLQALAQQGLRPLGTPADGAATSLTDQTLDYRVGPDGCALSLQLVGLPGTEHVRCQLSPFTRDPATGILLGYLHIAADTDALLALRMTAGVR